MKETPILFTGPLVRALLDRRKTQTRRLVTRLAGMGPITEFEVSDTPGYDFIFRDRRMRWNDLRRGEVLARCPYGQSGDRLWVKETGWERPERTARETREGADTWPRYEYDATGAPHEWCKENGYKRRPSIHMPRWASRITLTIAEVRLERIQDLTEQDARAEGMEYAESARVVFMATWRQIHGHGAWNKNPWVWVIRFRRALA